MILLTGASGFIGRHLLQALIKIYSKEGVVVLTSKPVDDCSYIIHNNYNFDVDAFEVAGFSEAIDTIIHAGAFTPKDSHQANDWRRCNQNIYSIENLLQASLPNLKKIIYLSTLDVYGNTQLITEDSAIDPATLYGHSKLYGEKLISFWSESNDVISHILRIGHVYGPGEEAYKKLIPTTIRKIIKNEPIELWGDGTELRAFIYIGDIVKSIITSLNLKERIGPVNLVSDNSQAIGDIINLIIGISGRNIEVKMIPTNAVPRNLKFDNRKLKKYLLSEEVSLLDGLKTEWDYMLNL